MAEGTEAEEQQGQETGTAAAPPEGTDAQPTDASKQAASVGGATPVVEEPATTEEKLRAAEARVKQLEELLQEAEAAAKAGESKAAAAAMAVAKVEAHVQGSAADGCDETCIAEAAPRHGSAAVPGPPDRSRRDKDRSGDDRSAAG